MFVENDMLLTARSVRSEMFVALAFRTGPAPLGAACISLRWSESSIGRCLATNILLLAERSGIVYR